MKLTTEELECMKAEIMREVLDSCTCDVCRHARSLFGHIEAVTKECDQWRDTATYLKEREG